MTSTHNIYKNSKYEATLGFVVVALIVLYVLFVGEFAIVPFLLWAYPVLGIIAAWLIMKISGIEKHQYFKRYKLSPAVAAAALGAPLAGLPIAIATIHSIPSQGGFDFSALYYAVAIFGAGQIFWLLWLTMGLKVVLFKRASLLTIVRYLECVVIIVGVLSIMPLVDWLVFIGAFYVNGLIFY